MPYIEGETLRQQLSRETRLATDEAVQLTAQIASALTYAHQCGVVHRDIKPENVLLVHDQAIVADFGIARAVEAAGGDGLTHTGFAIGTPAYMSPEQALGHPGVDGRADVYALGCVVFEMVSGRSPLEGLSPQALLARHAAGKLPRLRSAAPNLPLFVERAVERALATDPSDRFGTAAEFATALTSGTIVARPRRRSRRRWTAASAAALVLAGASLGVAAVLDAARIRRLAVLPLADLTGDSTQAYLVAGVHEALIRELGKLGLQMTARTTMQRFQGTEKPIGEIASELGVQAVIEGSFFRQGDSLEISARLIDRNEAVMWQGSYDGDLPNAFVLYRGFARAIADKVRARLSPAAQAALARRGSVNPAVYEAYLRGMYLLHQPGRLPEDVQEALSYFNQAIAADPADPLAYTGAANAGFDDRGGVVRHCAGEVLLRMGLGRRGACVRASEPAESQSAGQPVPPRVVSPVGRPR